MLAVEPPPTKADLCFRLFDFPVRVNPLFWLVAVFLIVGGGADVEPVHALVWVAVMFVSILIHELGHAFLQRHYGGRPRIVLYSFGGLAIAEDSDDAPRSQILISLAGPFAGFLLAAIVFAVVRLTGRQIGFLPPGSGVNLSDLGIDAAVVQPLIVFRAYFEPFTADLANQLVADLLQVNILWGLINLLPVYPLDGGRVSRELFTLQHPRQGIVRSLLLSAGCATGMAIFALMRGSLFTAAMFGYLAYANYQNMQAYNRHWR